MQTTNQPSTKEIEQLFFAQMKQLTKSTTGPKGLYSARLQSFDLQFSDRWL